MRYLFLCVGICLCTIGLTLQIFDIKIGLDHTEAVFPLMGIICLIVAFIFSEIEM